MPGGRQEVLPGTLLREYRARWEAGSATWNAFAGIPCQVGSRKGYLEHFRGETVAGGRQRRTPGTLSQEFRARWAAGKDTWYTFAGKPWQVGGGKGHLERFRGKTVAGGKQDGTPDTLLRENRGRWEAGKATWNAFAGILCQVDSRERTPGTLSRGNRGRWATGWDTWNAFAGIPWQVEGGEEAPGTLSRGFRAWWKAGRCYLERFCGDSVPGGQRDGTPATATARVR